MCTLTWRFIPQGYELLFNRDELRSRSIALPPQIESTNQTRFIAPKDIDGGGTWVGVNEYGLTICLLNHYPTPSPPPPPPHQRSRGLLVLELLQYSSITKAQSQIEALDLSVYPPFVLALFAPSFSAHTYAWNPQDQSLAQEHQPEPPISSSSFATKAVVAGRQSQYARRRIFSFVNDAKQLSSYHHSHSPEPGPNSVCMHRPDAQTVSLSYIRVDSKHSAFTYKPGPPCSTPALAPVVLQRPLGTAF